MGPVARPAIPDVDGASTGQARGWLIDQISGGVLETDLRRAQPISHPAHLLLAKGVGSQGRPQLDRGSRPGLRKAQAESRGPNADETARRPLVQQKRGEPVEDGGDDGSTNDGDHEGRCWVLRPDVVRQGVGHHASAVGLPTKGWHRPTMDNRVGRQYATEWRAATDSSQPIRSY